MGLKAVIENGVVSSVIVAEPDFELEGVTLVVVPEGEPVGPGWLCEGGAFVAPHALRSLEEAKTEKLAALAQKRWEVEVGGITVEGARIETDDRSKLLLLGKRTKAVENPEGTTRWKAGSGQFVDLPNTFIVAAADAVEAHVQACFDREGELTDAILDPSVDTLAKLDAIDIHSGWPE
jgi:hypothetical protein